AGPQVTLGDTQQQLQSLTVAAGASATMAKNGSHCLVARSLSISGTLDLADNDLIVDYTGTASPATDVEALVAVGFHGGDWLADRGIPTSPAGSHAFHRTVPLRVR